MKGYFFTDKSDQEDLYLCHVDDPVIKIPYFWSYDNFQREIVLKNDIPCPICNGQFLDENALVQHTVLEHEGVLKKCPFCAFTDFNKEDMALHLVKHKLERTKDM